MRQVLAASPSPEQRRIGAVIDRTILRDLLEMLVRKDVLTIEDLDELQAGVLGGIDSAQEGQTPRSATVAAIAREELAAVFVGLGEFPTAGSHRRPRD